MSEFSQQLINGLSLGSIYALIALGYTMVYGVLRFINFAHSDVFMVGAFAGYYLGNLLGGRFSSISALAWPAALILGFFIGILNVGRFFFEAFSPETCGRDCCGSCRRRGGPVDQSSISLSSMTKFCPPLLSKISSSLVRSLWFFRWPCALTWGS